MKVLVNHFPMAQVNRATDVSMVFKCPQIYNPTRKDAFPHTFKNGVKCIIVDGYIGNTTDSYLSIVEGIQTFEDDDDFVFIAQGNKSINKTMLVFFKPQ